MDEASECDEPDKGVIGQETKHLGQSRLEKRWLLLDHAGVDDEDEDGWRGRLLERRVVLDCGVLGEELGEEILIGNGGVVGREVVAGEAEGADPDLGGVIDGGEGVEDNQG
ncbi:hypothetical protein M0R45_004387 [Rubus argutus]|uniref:Uncharacterized protein n=1 Tax=Rubus argutus TaxID=59490 RepID=A0AAW1YJP4_RUBAR